MNPRTRRRIIKSVTILFFLVWMGFAIKAWARVEYCDMFAPPVSYRDVPPFSCDLQRYYLDFFLIPPFALACHLWLLVIVGSMARLARKLKP